MSVPSGRSRCLLRLTLGAALALPVASSAACSNDGDTNAAKGDVAVWNIDSAAPPEPSSASFTALVTRLGCSGGVTGEVRRPTVKVRQDVVVVTFTAAPIGEGFHTCPGNDQVRRIVQVGQPIGGRKLVDGACLAGRAKTTSLCEPGGVRWSPAAP